MLVAQRRDFIPVSLTERRAEIPNWSRRSSSLAPSAANVVQTTQPIAVPQASGIDSQMLDSITSRPPIPHAFRLFASCNDFSSERLTAFCAPACITVGAHQILSLAMCEKFDVAAFRRSVAAVNRPDEGMRGTSADAERRRFVK